MLQTDKGSLLIDAGISRRRIITGIKKLGVVKNDVLGILITHAHSDHVSGLPVLSSHLDAPVIATPGTITEINKLQHRDMRYSNVADKAISIEIGETIERGPFAITAYRTIHDIDGACGYTISYNDQTFSYATDTSRLVTPFIEAMRQSDYIFLESNHHKEMLENSRRPYWLKQRIRKTHLSNYETMKLLTNIVSEHTKAVFLGHLSGECNKPLHVCSDIHVFKQHFEFDKLNWIVCTREAPSSILKVKKDRIDLKGGLSHLRPPTNLDSRIKVRDTRLDQYF